MRTLAIFSLFAAAIAAQPTCLFTTLAAGNGQSGNMFDLVAASAVTIERFDIHISGTGTFNAEVYTTAPCTSYAGLHNTPAAWTLVGSFPGVVSSGLGVLTPLPPLTTPVPMPAGSIQGFYVTLVSSTAIAYTNGPANGTPVASDANLTMLAGSGHSYPFGSNFGGVGTTASRVFNGQICYTLGAPGASCPCPDVQTNQSAASFDLDGNNTGTPTMVATTMKCTSTPTVANVNSNVPVGNPWDMAIQFGPALVPGISSPTCQVLNVDLGPGAPFWLSNGMQSFSLPAGLPWGGSPLALPFTTPPVGGTAHAQCYFVDAGSPDFFSLSAPAQLDTIGVGSSINLTLADDNFIQVTSGTLPFCHNFSLNFYGTSYTSFFVNSNGSIGFTAGSTDFTATETEFLTQMPRAAFFWSDLSPNLGGTVSLTALPTGIDLAVSVPHFGAPAAVNTASVTIDGTGVTFYGYSPDPANTNPSIIGITPGGTVATPAIGSPQNWLGLVGAGMQLGIATDAVYQFSTGNVTPGWGSVNFPLADGSAFIVN